MKDYLKNKNEYIEDGKRYIEKIKSCTCRGYERGKYLVICKIQQRGNHYYLYDKKEGYISKELSKNRFYLSDSSEKSIKNSIDEFNSDVEKIKSGIPCVHSATLCTTFYYRHTENGSYDVLLEFVDKEGEMKTYIYNCRTLGDMISKIAGELNKDNEDEARIKKILLDSDKNTIAENPLYISAVETGDKLMQKQLRFHYRICDMKELSLLEKALGEKLLPALNEEFDRNIVVDSDTIDSSLLSDSGYRILHRPYFAMKDSTHGKWTLNPHKKTGVDAAKNDDPSMAFIDFLELFDNPENIVK